MQRPLIDRADTLEVILKVTERCNINCTYCYMFNKGNEDFRERPAAISSAWIDDVTAFLREGVISLSASKVNVVLHGGEPLLLKKDRFRELCGKLRSSLDGLAALEIGIQTNATLIDCEWVDIFAEFGIAIGISLDGPPEVNDRYRVDKKGRSTYDRTLAGIRLLQEAYNRGGIAKPGLICVINPENSGRKIYRHVVDDLGFTNVSFNLPMETNDTIAPGDGERIGRYLEEVFQEWTADDNPRIQIRIFDQMFRFFTDGRFRNLLPNFITRHVMVVIASDGTLSEHDDFKVINFAQRGGTVRDTSLYEFANSPLRRYLDLVAQTTPHACQSCDWKAYCRGGVTHGLTISRFSRDGGFDNRSSLCEAFRSLFERGAAYLMDNGFRAEDLQAALCADHLKTAAGARSLSKVPRELFS